MHYFLIFILLLASALPIQVSAQPDCVAVSKAMQSMKRARISLLDDGGLPVSVEVFIADDPTERAAGYQHICPRTIQHSAILFAYTEPIAGQFHMHNVKAPLDIGFFDGNGALIQSMLMHPYGDGEQVLYGPMQKFQFALEARAGFFAEKKLSAGVSRLRLDTLP